MIPLDALLGDQRVGRPIESAIRVRQVTQEMAERKGAVFPADEILEDFRQAMEPRPEELKVYMKFFLEDNERQARLAARPLYRKVGESVYYWTYQSIRCATLWPCDIHKRMDDDRVLQILEQSQKVEHEKMDFENFAIAVALDELKFSEQGRKVAEFIEDKSKGVSVRFVWTTKGDADAQYLIDERRIHITMYMLMNFPKSTAISLALAHEGFHAIQHAQRAKRPCLGFELEAGFMQNVIYHELLRARVRPVPLGDPFWMTYVLFSKRMRRRDYQGWVADATAAIYSGINEQTINWSKSRWATEKNRILNLSAVCPATRAHARLHEAQYAWQKRWTDEHWKEFLRPRDL